MVIQKIDYNRPSYFPKKAKDYIENNNFKILIPSIIIDGFEKFKDFNDFSTQEEKFIFKINNFDNDYNKILSISLEMKKIINSLNNDYNELLDSINKIELADLNSMINNIFDLAVKYERNYTVRKFIPKFNGEYFCINCLFSEYPIKNHEGDNDSIEKYINIVNFMREYGSFIRNFLNLVYVDGEDAEEFLKVKFLELMKNYTSIVSTIEELNKKNKLNTFEERLKKLDFLNEDITKIFDDYPATIFKVIFEFYYRNKGSQFSWDQLGLEKIDYRKDLMIF